MNTENKKPSVVKIHDVNIDKDYVGWIEELKSRYRSAQIKSVLKVNAEQLKFNWELGKDLVIRRAEEKWGAGIVEQVSLDLQAAFPESKGFGTSNLWYMKKWYIFYSSERQKVQHIIGELKTVPTEHDKKIQLHSGKLHDTTLAMNAGLDFPDIFSFIPWGHHIDIITHCKTIEEAFFYINKTITEHWSRNTLNNSIKSNFFKTSGGAITNFSEKLTSPHSELAQAITKDTYDFGFLTLDNGYKEDALETELERHLTRFLLELGTGFAYLGRQKQIVIAGKTRKLDMLFYHINLRCYIVIELKVTPFQPEYVGKLNFYVNAVNDLIKQPEDNPTIGILICSNKDETEVQYAFESVQNPMGVASYDNIKIREIQNQLPSVEELTKRIRFLEEQLNQKR